MKKRDIKKLSKRELVEMAITLQREVKLLRKGIMYQSDTIESLIRVSYRGGKDDSEGQVLPVPK